MKKFSGIKKEKKKKKVDFWPFLLPDSGVENTITPDTSKKKKKKQK